MRRYFVTLIAFNALIFVLSARGQTTGSAQTYAVGPLTLCSGELVEVLAYNPDTLSRSVDVELVDYETGRTVDRSTTYIGAGRGTRLGASIDRAYVDELPKTATPDCRKAGVVTLVVIPPHDQAASRPVYFSGRLLSARDLTREQTYGRRVSFGVVEMSAPGRATTAPVALDGPATLRIANVGDSSALVTATVKDAIEGAVITSRTATVAAKKWLPSNFNFELASLPDAAVVELEVRPEVAGAELDARLAIAIEAPTPAGEVAMEELTLAHEGFELARERTAVDRVYFNYDHFHNSTDGSSVFKGEVVGIEPQYVTGGESTAPEGFEQTRERTPADRVVFNHDHFQNAAVSNGMQDEDITEEQLSNANEAEFAKGKP